MRSYEVTRWGAALELRDHPTPIPTGQQVLLRLTHCGVCHTDVHVRDGYFNLSRGQRLSLADRGVRLPHTLGHEAVGVVESFGADVENIRNGETFLVNPWVGCGKCPMCLSRRENLCPQMNSIGVSAPGGFASHLIVPDPRYLVGIGGLDPALAAPLACSGLTTYRAVKKLLPIHPGEWVAVVGCGGLGLMAIAILHGLGHANIIACDVDDSKFPAAIRQGANHTCNLATQGKEHIANIAGGGLCAILDFVGNQQTFDLAIPTLRKGGSWVVSGLFGGEASFPVAMLALREISFVGSFVGTTDDLKELVALAVDGRIRFDEIIRRPLSQAERSLADLAEGKVVGRIVLDNRAE